MVSTAVREGKSKLLTPGPGPDELTVQFKDEATAFNGQKHAVIAGKGALNARISQLFFELLEREGIPTCFKAVANAPATLVFQQLHMIPLEIVVRNVAYGSICKRYGLEEGTALARPLIEFFVKNDALNDPQISEDVIEGLGYLPDGVSLTAIKTLARAANEVFIDFLAPRGIVCADFKLEMGVDAHGTVRIGDELSPDNFRFRDAQTGQVLDKDVFRRDLADLVTTYQALLARLETPAELAATDRHYTGSVYVRSRKNVLSPESKAIQNALQTLGFAGVTEIHAGRQFQLKLRAPRQQQAQAVLTRIAQEVLSNPVIEDVETAIQ
jgi:phosphoribosylaminoimidazole-succinocarboxamide synthase